MRKGLSFRNGEAIASVHSTTGPDQISDEEGDRLWRAGQALRRQLSADLGSSDTPRMRGTQPYVTPPPKTRIGNSSIPVKDDAS